MAATSPGVMHRRKIALGVVGTLVGLGMIGGCGSQPTETKPAADANAAVTSSAAPTAERLAATPSPSPSAAVIPAAPPLPVMTMTCPAGGTNSSPVFGQQITATAPYSVIIDYGDGDRYTNDDQHLGAIFSHTYGAGGTFPVTAVLTDATGQTAQATCTYTWTKPASAPTSRPAPAPAPAPQPAPAPAPAPAPGPSGGVHPGAFCSPEGATGHTSAGTLMVCSTKPGDSRARWRSA